jgi:uncharacterized protein Smg (DUF494 family)
LNEKVLDCVGIIIENLTVEVQKKEEVLIKNLLSKGYSLKEVETAFRWIAQTVLSSKNHNQNKDSLRILTTCEKSKISVEAWDMLLKLKNSSIIDDELIEEILERAMNISSEDEINADQMKTIVQLSIFDSLETQGKDPKTLFYH